MLYNTKRTSLTLPEYGRHVQQMVEYCMSLPDKDSRTACAHEIVKIMRNMFPSLGKSQEKPNMAWDVINRISGFSLDIDWPCEVTSRETLQAAPAHVPYRNGFILHRHYGGIIQRMIDAVVSLPEGDEKRNLTFLIASHMKKLMTQHNREGAEDMKIFRDLAAYSNGRIVINPEECILADYSEAQSRPQQFQKRKNNQKQNRNQNMKRRKNNNSSKR